MAERVERAVGNAPEVRLVRLKLAGRVGPAGALVSVIIGLLARTAREACRQAARRSVRTEEDVGDGIAGLGAEKPGREDRLRIRDSAFERQCAPVLEHNDHGLAGRGDRFGEPLLRLGHHDFGARLRFAGHVGAFADSQDDDVGRASGSDRLFDTAGEWFLHTATLRNDERIPAGERRTNAARKVNRFLVIAVHDPWSDEIVRTCGERADQGDPLARPRQRQKIAVVLEQNNRLAAGLACKRPRFRQHRPRRFAPDVDAPERIVEQAEHRLQRKHPADRFIEPRLRHRAAAHQSGQMLAIEPALHAHVDAGEEGEQRRLAAVAGKTMGDHLFVAGIIADDEALKIPFAAQEVGHQPMVARRWHAIDLVERGHGGQGAGIKAGLVGLKIDLAQPRLGHVDAIVVKARLRRAVGREMLDAGEQAVGRPQVSALKTMHSGRGEQAPEEHILAASLDSPAPALVARDVDHGRKCPVDARPGGFECRRLGGPAREIGLEARDFRKRDREDGAVTVNDVGREDQRNLHPRFPGRRRLEDASHGRAIAVEHAGKLPLARFLDLFRKVGVSLRRIERERRTATPGRCHQLQLASLLFEGHAADELADECRNGNSPDRLQKRARRASEPGGNSARPHECRTPRDARIQHELPLHPVSARRKSGRVSTRFLCA